jgi:hypothetical protein
MVASVLVGLSARLLQWQNPAEFGVQFLNGLRARRAQGSLKKSFGFVLDRRKVFANSSDQAAGIPNQG